MSLQASGRESGGTWVPLYKKQEITWVQDKKSDVWIKASEFGFSLFLFLCFSIRPHKKKTTGP